jgi:spermidine synthase
VFFVFFLTSGFCSLVYEVVWLRLAMAQFGVTTPLVSIVLSVFMAGLALGSWGAGRIARRLRGSRPATLIRLYAAAELVIAASVTAVPAVLAWGRGMLSSGGAGNWGSSGYYLASAAWVTLAILPFCICMGATLPLAMAAIRRASPADSARSFSYLYVANLVGATAGTLASAFVLIELLGFRGTLAFTAGLNALLAAAALAVSLRPTREATPPPDSAPAPARPASGDGLEGRRIVWALFATGLASMAMEVVWVRQLTPYLGNVVYTFATILALYLVATFAGSRLYRFRTRRGGGMTLPATAWALMATVSLLPLVAADPRLPIGPPSLEGLFRAAVAIVPFCAALGFATPLLVDRWSAGDPGRAGLGYAINVVGCLLGPLVAGFLLLPLMGERWSLLLLAVPLLALGALAGGGAAPAPRGRVLVLGAAAAAGLLLFAVSRTFESQFPGAIVKRDSTATVTASGEGRHKRLLVNGVGMTYLTPITKMMAHLPLMFAREPPRRALTICFGMGTSFRSTLSWGIDAWAVELVPSVPALFGYFHADGDRLLASPRAHVVIDDGRRFLERSRENYDAIVIDPPPPVEAAGSSLLYSREFYEVLKRRLGPHGIVQQWIPGGDEPVVAAFVRAFRDSFPYTRGFASIHGWGLHLLGSQSPIPRESAAVLAARLPPDAARDLLEWGPAGTAEEQIGTVLAREVPIEVFIARGPRVRALRDDRPINEYYLLRHLRRPPPVVSAAE